MANFSNLSERLDNLIENFTFGGGIAESLSYGLVPLHGKYQKERKEKALETILPEYDGDVKSAFKVGDDWSDLYNKLYDYYIEQGVRSSIARKAAKRDLKQFYRSRLPDFNKFNQMLKTARDMNTTAQQGVVYNNEIPKKV